MPTKGRFPIGTTSAMCSFCLVPLLAYCAGETLALQRTQWSAPLACAPDTIEIATPFRVRQIRGSIKDPAGYPLGSGVQVLVEVVSKGQPITTWTTQTDSSGRFQIADMAEGEYRFRIGMKELGWACTEGTIIISKRAPANSLMAITLQLGR